MEANFKKTRQETGGRNRTVARVLVDQATEDKEDQSMGSGGGAEANI